MQHAGEPAHCTDKHEQARALCLFEMMLYSGSDPLQMPGTPGQKGGPEDARHGRPEICFSMT